MQRVAGVVSLDGPHGAIDMLTIGNLSIAGAFARASDLDGAATRRTAEIPAEAKAASNPPSPAANFPSRSRSRSPGLAMPSGTDSANHRTASCIHAASGLVVARETWAQHVPGCTKTRLKA